MHLSILTAALSASDSYKQMKISLILLAVICVASFLSSIIFTLTAAQFRWRRKARKTQWRILKAMYIVTLLLLVCILICFIRYNSVGKMLNASTSDLPTDATTQTEAPVEPTEPVDWEIIKGGKIVDSIHSTGISFGDPDSYFALPGIATFRGNNFRNSAVYGTVDVVEKTLTKAWGRDIDTLNGWPGSGWTGQPLMVQWDQETKNIMNMYPEKKTKDGLVEVIYATLDGNIYFYDLEDGSYTRDPIYVGMNFKGAGALDPRGYPIMYVGSGDYLDGKAPRMYFISLIDGSILYEKSGNDGYSKRPDWTAFDSSPLVDAETDTLIWPGENGILYTIKLNTQYDKAAGTLSIKPAEFVKTRYYTNRSNNNTYWIGYEPSCVIVDRYLYISENGGMFFCVDLDTMQLIWYQDTRDDSNSTPVFEPNATGGYIYTAPSLHWTADKADDGTGTGHISIYKLDAKTGEIIWEQRFNCGTVDGVSGGVQSTPVLGKPGTELEGLIIYTIARTPNMWDGKLVAFDTETGEIVWEKAMDNYSWSSPVAVYGSGGKAYIITCDSAGEMQMLDSKGTVLSTINLGSNIEASPAVFNDMLVIGTRGRQIYGIQIK